MVAERAIGNSGRLIGERRQCPVLQSLLTNGIDDLTKYQIMFLLCRQPIVEADVDFLAKTLGLWSAARTEAALGELVESGLLERRHVDGGRVCKYRLSSAGHNCRTCITWIAERSDWQRETLSRPASGSLMRAKAASHRQRAWSIVSGRSTERS